MSKKEELIEQIKKSAFELSKEYKGSIKLEINLNPKYESVKVNVTEFNK